MHGLLCGFGQKMLMQGVLNTMGTNNTAGVSRLKLVAGQQLANLS